VMDTCETRDGVPPLDVEPDLDTLGAASVEPTCFRGEEAEPDRGGGEARAAVVSILRGTADDTGATSGGGAARDPEVLLAWPVTARWC
jgi:hypothetical protein